MNKPNLWTKHYQNVWLERSVDPRFEAAWRCASYAYGTHRANGHSPLSPGELASVLGKPGVAMDKRNVTKVIRRAKELGLISPRSSARCLVVPEHAVAGPTGNPFAPCPVHGVITGGRPSRPVRMTHNALTCENTDVLLESLNQPEGNLP